jgi:hypothetical protein
MTNSSYKNEQIKRQFLEHLKGAKGFADDSLDKHAEAVYQWQIFSGEEDFATFTKEKAIKFCDWLSRAIIGQLVFNQNSSNLFLNEVG